MLKRISFTLAPGQVLGVVGPSGAGKTTLGRLIAGTLHPSAGHIRVDGADIGIWQASGGHGYFGYLPQDVETAQRFGPGQHLPASGCRSGNGHRCGGPRRPA